MSQIFKFVKNIKGTSEKSGKAYNSVILSTGLAMLPPLNNPNNLDFTNYKEGDDIALETLLTVGYKGDLSAQVTGIIDLPKKKVVM